MASVKILRILWRYRVLVGIAFFVAMVVAWMIAFGPSMKSRTYKVGVASASVLVDTPKSQVVEIAPAGSDTLGARANVLANLMVDGDIKDAIAKRVNVPSNKLIAWVDTGDGVGPATPLTKDSIAYSTAVAVTSDMAELPIIRVTTQAPDVRRAITIANAVVEGLSASLDTKAADETVSDTRRLRVRALGTAQGHESTRGPGKKTALAAAFFAFLIGCAVIVGLSALNRGWRAAVASERTGGDTATVDILGGEQLPGEAVLWVPPADEGDDDADEASEPTTRLRV